MPKKKSVFNLKHLHLKVAEKNVTVSFYMYERTDGHTGKTVSEAEV